MDDGGMDPGFSSMHISSLDAFYLNLDCPIFRFFFKPNVKLGPETHT
jgi:hypothetical protein